MYDFNQVIDRTNTNCVKYDAMDSIYGTNALQPFWIADMDLPTFPGITEAIQNRLTHPIIGYSTYQTNDFFSPIKHWFQTRFDINVLKQDIGYAPTVLFTITEVIRMLTNEFDGVIVNTPSYNAFLTLIEGNKRMVVESPLEWCEDRYEMNFTHFEYLCQMPQNKIFILCNPQNPTGKVFTNKELLKIVEICEKNDVFIISDEIHMDFARKTKHISMAKMMASYDKILVTTCLGKSFNISGMQHSYFITKDHFVKERLIQQMMTVYGLFGANPLIIQAVKAAYLEGHDYIDALNAHIENNMQIIDEFIQRHLNHTLEFHQPEGTFLAWIDFRKSGFSEIEVFEALKSIGHIAVGEGSIYELHETTHFRFNAAVPESILLEGLDRIKLTFETLYKKRNQH